MKVKNFTIWFSCMIVAAPPMLSVIAEAGDTNESEMLKMAPIKNNNLMQKTITPGRNATREQACGEYAKDTVEQLTWLENNDCGYGENPLSNSQLLIDYDVEYNNCMNKYPRKLGEKEFELSEIPKIIKERQKAIADCLCKPYAYDAVRQNDENLEYACGERDSRWSSDFSYHYDWCARGGGSIINSGSWARFSDDRESVLQICKKQAPIALKPNGYPKLEKYPAGYVELTWKDPTQDLPQAAHRYELDVTVNDRVLEKGLITDLNHYRLSYDKLPYSAKVVWRVMSRNYFGPSNWSNASFKIENKPVPPGTLNIVYQRNHSGLLEIDPYIVLEGRRLDSGYINAKTWGERKFRIKAKAKRVGDIFDTSANVGNLEAGRWDIQADGGYIRCEAMVPGWLKLVRLENGLYDCKSKP